MPNTEQTPETAALPAKCPNCWTAKTEPHDGCVLEAIVACVAERDEISEARLMRLWKTCDTQMLWEYMGDVIDRFQRGEFSDVEEEEEDDTTDPED